MAKKTDISVIIMIAVIAAFAVLGGFAVAPTVQNIIANREIEARSERFANGTATVADLANSEGMKIDEFIAEYELKADEVNEDTAMTEFLSKLTLKNYCDFAGVVYTDDMLEDYKAENEAAKDLTDDTTDLAQKVAFVQYLSQKQQSAAQDAVQQQAPAEAE